ncbi:MAG: hypothetical protein ACRD50_11015 [Candidatus Acidiferrales bacterium]
MYIRYAMGQQELSIRWGHVMAVLMANAVLWVAALVIVGDARLAGAAAVALISIGSLALARRKAG